MKSILTFDGVKDPFEVVEAVERATHGKVIAFYLAGEKLKLTIEHHGRPSCPECGQGIHNYGHGLCRNCWLDFKSKSGAVS